MIIFHDIITIAMILLHAKLEHVYIYFHIEKLLVMKSENKAFVYILPFGKNPTP